MKLCYPVDIRKRYIPLRVGINWKGMGHEASSLGQEVEVKGGEEHQLLDTAVEEEDYNCPICQDVLKSPIRTEQCRHVFCKDCFCMAVRAQGPHCPMCRGPIGERQERAVDIQQQMKTRSGRCQSCGTKRLLSRMRSHSRHCRKYIEEFGGPVSDAAEQAQSTSQQAANIAVTIPVTITGSVLVPVFLEQGRYSCPYCMLPGFTDCALVQHCLSLHRRERSPKVCPICACTSWGDANYCSRNLIGHLTSRHRFSYDAYMNTSVDVDTQLYQTIQQSMDEAWGTMRA